MSARRIFARPARFAAIVPYLWMVLFFVVPFGFVLKISLSQTAIAQPPYLPLFDLTLDWVPDEATPNRILVQNPGKLYGFWRMIGSIAARAASARPSRSQVRPQGRRGSGAGQWPPRVAEPYW